MTPENPVHSTPVETDELLKQAIQCHQTGQLDRAESFYRRVLEQAPDHAGILHCLAMIAYQKHQYDSARQYVSRAIAVKADVAQFHNTLGLILEGMDQPEEAINAYKAALALNPNDPQVRHNMAIALQTLGRYDQAVQACTEALARKPNDAKLHNTLGFCLSAQGRSQQAMQSFARALQLEPGFVEPYFHLGVLFNEQGRYDEAVTLFSQALDLAPDYAEARCHLGMALKALHRSDEAVEQYHKALQSDPGFVDAYYNLGNALVSLGRCREAIDAFNKAIELDPGHAKSHWNLSHALLLSGQLTPAWEHFSRRHQPDLNIRTYPHRLPGPVWDGHSFTGQRLLVHYEQGYGDMIQFARFLPRVKALGGTLIVEVRQPLYRLFRSIPEIDELVQAAPDGSAPTVPNDCHVSLLDLPGLFKTSLETLPGKVPYLQADPQDVADWQHKLPQDGFKVGLVWSGNPRHGKDQHRSCPWDIFSRLLQVNGPHWVSLQMPPERSEALLRDMNVLDLGPALTDFADTAAVMSHLDLVITVDTAVLHLAGALGKPTWALIPFEPDWRWMLQREDSPWYPTVRLFRQQQRDCWENVINPVSQELQTQLSELTLTIKD